MSVTVPAPAERPVPAAPVWRGVAWRCVLAPLVVLSPLIALEPDKDHRFNVYANGAAYLTRPWDLITTAIDTVPTYLRLGNFRPLGRIAEWALDVLAFALTALLGLPANVTLRLVSFAAAILLTAAATVLTESVVARGRLFRQPPSTATAMMPFAVAAGFVAAGSASTTVLFGGLYFLTGALVLGVAAAASSATGRSRIGLPRAALIVAAGAGLAAFNEMASLAVPLATVVVLLRGRLTLGLSLRRSVRGAGGRFAGLLWLGFLPVFVPVRALIYLECSDGGCYSGSDVALAGAPAALPNRLLSWLPPLMWPWATDGRAGRAAAGMLVVALAAFLLLALRFRRDLPRYVVPDRRQAYALIGAAVAVLALAAALGALNPYLQAVARMGRWGMGWRDSGLATAGGGMLLVGLAAALSRRSAALLLTVALAGAAAVSAAANKEYRPASRYPYLNDRVAQEIVDFDRTPAGDARRCALRAEFVAESIAVRRGLNRAEIDRFDESVNLATAKLAGRPFCEALR